MQNEPAATAGSLQDNETASDVFKGWIRRAADNKPLSALSVDNGKLLFSDIGELSLTSSGALRWWLRRGGYASNVTLDATGVPFTNYSAPLAQALRSLKLTRSIYVNPMPAALPTGATNFAADYIDSPTASTFGATVSWRWPLDSQLAMGFGSAGPELTGNAVGFYDQDQMTFAQPGIAASTCVDPPVPIAAVQISISPSGWTVASTATNTVPYQPSNFGAGAGAVAPTTSTASSSYEAVPTGAIHLAIGWMDTGGSYQHARVQLEPFSDNISARTTVTVLFASKPVSWTASTRDAYNKYGDRCFVPAGLRSSAFPQASSMRHLAGPNLGLNTCGYTGGSSTSDAQPGCSWVSVRLYYEAPTTNALRLLNPVSCRVSLRTMDEMARMASLMRVFNEQGSGLGGSSGARGGGPSAKTPFSTPPTPMSISRSPKTSPSSGMSGSGNTFGPISGGGFGGKGPGDERV